MNGEIILGAIAIIVTISAGFYKLHRNMIDDRIKIENRLTKVEEQLETYKMFYDVLQRAVLQDFENKVGKSKER
ncbi:MAG: hypothetical protein IB616_03430 [Methanosarcinales archaeon]|nr:MAG: hypothetical protein IB616_03430 [Methanosarcinales archaeon]